MRRATHGSCAAWPAATESQRRTAGWIMILASSLQKSGLRQVTIPYFGIDRWVEQGTACAAARLRGGGSVARPARPEASSISHFSGRGVGMQGRDIMTYRLLIDGALVDGAVTVEVVNPATGRPFAIAPRADVVQLERAVAAAKRAFPTWSRTRWAERQALLAAIADVLADKGEEFARLLTQEQGKTLTEARGEMEGTIAAFRYFATLELSPRVLRDTA